MADEDFFFALSLADMSGKLRYDKWTLDELHAILW